jgi:hypothetical protein
MPQKVLNFIHERPEMLHVGLLQSATWCIEIEIVCHAFTTVWAFKNSSPQDAPAWLIECYNFYDAFD